MTTKVEKSIEVDVPVSTAYNQWTQFEEFPRFMGGVQEVRQFGDTRLHWVAEIAGVKREWDAEILEQVPDRKVAWAATSGATNAGSVYFAPAGTDHTTVTLALEYEPEGLIENVGDKLNFVARQAESDLKKFKSYIESRGVESGAWRGSVNEGTGVGTPGVEDASMSRGDSGKAGVSGKAVAAGAAAAAVGAVAAASAMKGKSSDSDVTFESTESTYAADDLTAVPREPIVEQSDLLTDRQAGYAAGPATDEMSTGMTGEGYRTGTGMPGESYGTGIGTGEGYGTGTRTTGVEGEQYGTDAERERYEDDRRTF